MISGAHVVVYSKNAEGDRTFLRDIPGFKSVDTGSWLGDLPAADISGKKLRSQRKPFEAMPNVISAMQIARPR